MARLLPYFSPGRPSCALKAPSYPVPPGLPASQPALGASSRVAVPLRAAGLRGRRRERGAR